MDYGMQLLPIQGGALKRLTSILRPDQVLFCRLNYWDVLLPPVHETFLYVEQSQKDGHTFGLETISEH